MIYPEYNENLYIYFLIFDYLHYVNIGSQGCMVYLRYANTFLSLGQKFCLHWEKVLMCIRFLIKYIFTLG